MTYLGISTVLTAMALSIGLAAAQSPSPGGDPHNGEQLFMKDGCYQCHGTVGQGARATGPQLGPTRLPFESFVTQLRTPSNNMPPYTTRVLSDQQAADIYAFLGGVAAPTDIKTVSILH